VILQMSLHILNRNELASLALKIINKVKEADKKTGGKVSEKFRTRARELFSLCNYLGTHQVTAFTYAKAAEKNISGIESVERTLKYLEGQENAIDGIKEEALSYSLYGAAILHYLKKTGISINTSSLEEILKTTEEYEFLILPFMSWLKLMAEAELTQER